MSGVAPSVGTPTHRTHEDNISTADLVAFQTRFAGWVRAADPKQRPISTGHATPRQGAWHLAQSYYAPQRDWGLDTEAQFTESVATQSAGCDIISYHYCTNPPNHTSRAVVSCFTSVYLTAMVMRRRWNG